MRVRRITLMLTEPTRDGDTACKVCHLNFAQKSGGAKLSK